MMDKSLAADHIYSLSSAQLPQRQLDTAVTVLMLVHTNSNIRLGYTGLRKQRYRIDSRLVTRLLETASDTHTRRAIVHSPAFWHLPRHLFRRFFFQHWRTRRGNAWRWSLGWTLSAFLHSHPEDAEAFVDVVWTIADDPDETISLAGLANTRHLGRALTLQRAEHLVALSRDPTGRSEAALSNLSELYRGIRKLRPEVRAYLLDAATIATLRSANPKHGRGKWSGYRFCMTNARKALARHRRGRVPKPVT
jgi:hypothetical protein